MPGGSYWKVKVDHLADRLVAGELTNEQAQEQQLAWVNQRLDQEGLRGKVWMVMPYVCVCGARQWYEAEVGVEGPSWWKDDQVFIPSPYSAGRCQRCAGVMAHVIGSDVVFAEPRDQGLAFAQDPALAPTTYAARIFRVPRAPVTYVTEGCDDDGNVIYGSSCHAFLATPLHAIRRATSGVRG
jgi:hypothetical protein